MKDRPIAGVKQVTQRSKQHANGLPVCPAYVLAVGNHTADEVCLWMQLSRMNGYARHLLNLEDL